MTDTVLQIENLHVSYGNIAALKGISLDVHNGKLVAVIGSNGAGKTTMLKTISGLLTPTKGQVKLSGKTITGMAAHKITGLGVAHSPEGRRVFASQSVEDNLLLGAYLRKGEGRKALEREMEKIFGIFPRLKERRLQLSGTLSGGEQQMLAIGRALMLKPQILLLDEPSMGLAPVIIDDVFRVIVDLRNSGMTILLVEQLAYRALKVADYAYVLEQGLVKLSGTGQELLGKPEVQRAYLGAKNSNTCKSLER